MQLNDAARSLWINVSGAGKFDGFPDGTQSGTQSPQNRTGSARVIDQRNRGAQRAALPPRRPEIAEALARGGRGGAAPKPLFQRPRPQRHPGTIQGGGSAGSLRSRC
jgi:hypothetical protein